MACGCRSPFAARLREAHITRKTGATTKDATAIAADDAGRAEFRTETLRERLAEREFEDELELLPAREVLTRIHDLLGIEPDQDQWPKHWPDEAVPGPEPEGAVDSTLEEAPGDRSSWSPSLGGVEGSLMQEKTGKQLEDSS